jgi:S1-C subfamily serine protease
LIIRGSGTNTTVEGLGFAIPSTNVMVISTQIIEKGYVSRPYLGIRYQYITPTIASRYGLPVEWGVYVSGIIPGSPAEKAGLQPGDIITQLGNIPIDETHPYYNTLFSFSPGDEVEIHFIRNGRKMVVKLVLEEPP